MKYIKIVICLIFIINLNGLSQEKKKENNQEVILLTQQNKELQKNIDFLQKRLDESITEIKREEKFFSNLNLYFVILGILITAFAIFIPLLSYLLGVRPARLEIKNLKQKVHDYIISKNRDAVDFAIEKLSSEAEKDRYNAALILSNNVDFKYNDIDLGKIVNAYSSIKDSQTRFFIKNILSTRESIVSEKFFRELLKNEKLDQNILHILRYIFTSNSDFTADLAFRLNELEKPLIQYSTLVSFSISISHNLTKSILDNEKLIDPILTKSDLKDIKSIKESINQAIKYNIGEDFYTNTYFCRKSEESIKLEEQKIENEKQGKIDSSDEAKTKTKSMQEVILENGLHIKEGVIIDKSGKEYLKKQYVLTLMGFNEVREGVKVDNTIIFLDDIKEQNCSG